MITDVIAAVISSAALRRKAHPPLELAQVPVLGGEMWCWQCKSTYVYDALHAKEGACMDGKYYCDGCRRASKCGCR